MIRGKGSAGHRFGLMAIDQVVAGASSVIIAILAARLLTVEEFGLFGIVFLVYMILVGVTRALVSDPLLVHPEEVEERAGEAIGTTCVLAVPLSAALVGVGLVIHTWSASLGNALMVLAAFLPLLVLQDLARYLGFATQRPQAAVLQSSVWLVLMLISVSLAFSISDGRSLAGLIAAWAGSGAVAGLLVFTRYSIRDVRLNLSWLRYAWSLSWRYLVSYVSTQGSALGVSSLVGAIAGARALGGVQGALLLARPFTLFQVTAVRWGITEIARSTADRARIWRYVLVTSALGGGVAAATMAVMVLLPTSIGEALLGEAWGPTEPLLVPTGLYIVATGVISGPAAALFGLRAMREATGINVIMAVLSVVAAGIGAAVDGATGAMWFSAGAQGIVLVLWWAAFWVRIHKPEPAEPAQTDGGLATVGP